MGNQVLLRVLECQPCKKKHAPKKQSPPSRNDKQTMKGKQEKRKQKQSKLLLSAPANYRPVQRHGSHTKW